MLTLKVKEIGMSETVQHLYKMPGVFAKARKSALKNTGYFVADEVKNYIQAGGQNWDPLHPLSQKLRRLKGKWSPRRKKGPLASLIRFVRYHADEAGTEVKIFFNYGRVGSYEQADEGLKNIVEETETGQRMPVTVRMRKVWSYTKAATRKKKPQIGKDYFMLKKTTTQLEVPKREIFGPVLRRIEGKVYRRFSDKFYQALDRYGA